jgi:hypothetical protein
MPKMIKRDFEPHFSVKHMLKDMQIANQLGWAHYLDLGVTAAARDKLLEQLQWGRGDDDFSAVARKYLAETQSSDHEEPQRPEQEEQASPEAVAPAPETTLVSAQMSSPPKDATTRADPAGSGDVREAIPWRRGFLKQLFRRRRQLRKHSEPVLSKEG